MKYIFLIFGLLVGSYTVVQGQDPRLAEQYYKYGEYEKASVIFQQLYKKNPHHDYYFNRFIECLTLLDNYTGAEKELKKRIKKYPNNCLLYTSPSPRD